MKVNSYDPLVLKIVKILLPSLFQRVLYSCKITPVKFHPDAAHLTALEKLFSGSLEKNSIPLKAIRLNNNSRKNAIPIGSVLTGCRISVT